MVQWIKLFSEFVKLHIALSATLAVAVGFVLSRGNISRELIFPCLSLFILACGSCGLNQYQDRIIDSLMERTRARPIPSGRISPPVALFCAIGMILSGLALFLYGTPSASVILALFALAWYNGVYTYLKRRTALAPVPGSIIGMVPPAIGWISGGGGFLDTGFWGLAIFFFLWQVPHFWLFALDHADDYEKAGLPSLKRLFSADRVRDIISIWILATACVCFCMPLFLLVRMLPVHLLLITASFWLLHGTCFPSKSNCHGTSCKMAFRRLNLYVLSVLLLLSVDTLANSETVPVSGILAMVWR